MRGTHARVEQAPVAPTASKRLLRTLGLRRTAMRTSDHGRSNEQMNPFPEWIHRFILFTMIEMISDH